MHSYIDTNRFTSHLAGFSSSSGRTRGSDNIWIWASREGEVFWRCRAAFTKELDGFKVDAVVLEKEAEMCVGGNRVIGQ